MKALAVVFQAPHRLALQQLELTPPGADDVVVDVEWSGISTGTERLLWEGRMPSFPGMGYPLVPGYESVGRVVQVGAKVQAAGMAIGQRVFVPGAKCFGDVRGLFGGAASRVVLPAARALPIAEQLAEHGVLLALAATAYHVAGGERARQPDLIIGHGVLGRMLARLAVAAGASPTVWETNPARRDVGDGAAGYNVVDPTADARRDYRCICDVSGDAALLDTLIARLAPGGEVVLAGFYDTPLSFVFAPAFMREARIRVAAQWQPADLIAVRDMAADGTLDLHGLVTHRMALTNEVGGMTAQADAAYQTAFGDAACLKMTLDWRQ